MNLRDQLITDLKSQRYNLGHLAGEVGVARNQISHWLHGGMIMLMTIILNGKLKMVNLIQTKVKTSTLILKFSEVFRLRSVNTMSVN